MNPGQIIYPGWKTGLVSFMIMISVAGCNFNNHTDHSKTVFTNAVSYNDYIISRQKLLVIDLDSFNSAGKKDYQLASNRLDTLLIHTIQNLEELKKLAPFNGDSSFRETTIDVFNYYINTFVPDSRKVLLNKLRMYHGTASDSDYIIYNAYLKKIARQSAPIEKRLAEIQDRFAKKNNFLLTGKEKKEE